jgi:hypothetical protein
MGVTVNLAALFSVRRKLYRLSNRAHVEEVVARRLGATAVKLMADEFRQSRDPYGKPWKAVFRRGKRHRDARRRAFLKFSKGGGSAAGLTLKGDKPLIDTGRLRAAATSPTASQPIGGKVRIVIPVDYASYHQTGTRRIARRQIVPETSTGGLGPIWTKALEREAARALKDIAL